MKKSTAISIALIVGAYIAFRFLRTPAPPSDQYVISSSIIRITPAPPPSDRIEVFTDDQNYYNMSPSDAANLIVGQSYSFFQRPDGSYYAK